MILVFGQSGQVASEIQRLGEVTALGRDAVDLRDSDAIAKAIHAHNPQVIINAAAYTAVDKAETEVDLAMQVNAFAPKTMALAAKEIGSRLVHISTDYVFDGHGTKPHRPKDPTNPIGSYGKTKLAGEDAIRETGVDHVILRTSWVFSAHGSNFVKTMLKLAESRDSLTVVADQIGGPTPARSIAAACLAIAGQKGPSGTYHFSGKPDASWADFAREIFRQVGKDTHVLDIPTSDYPTPAPRPLNSRMNCETLLQDYGIAQPDWREELAQVLRELTD